jgi:hypothetical protein
MLQAGLRMKGGHRAAIRGKAEDKGSYRVFAFWHKRTSRLLPRGHCRCRRHRAGCTNDRLLAFSYFLAERVQRARHSLDVDKSSSSTTNRRISALLSSATRERTFNCVVNDQVSDVARAQCAAQRANPAAGSVRPYRMWRFVCELDAVPCQSHP